MSKLVRKNLMVDPDDVAALAAARGTSESEAVRYAVAEALAAEEATQALQHLHELGAFSDSLRTRRIYGDVPSIDPRTGRVRVADAAVDRATRGQRTKPASRRAS